MAVVVAGYVFIMFAAACAAVHEYIIGPRLARIRRAAANSYSEGEVT